MPLYRISVLGLGKENPVADNKTRKERDQNRRVEVTLLKQTLAADDADICVIQVNCG